MNTATILTSFGINDLTAALEKWTSKTEDRFNAVVNGYKIAIGDATYNDSILPGLAGAIEFGTADIVGFASIIAQALIEKNKSASTLILQLNKSKRTQARVGMFYCLPPGLCDDFLTQILSHAISDKSKKVRETAIDWIGRNRMLHFLPLLKKTLEAENDLKMKNYILREISLLQNGFHVSRENGAIYISEASPNGIVAGFLNKPYKDGLSDREIFDLFREQLSNNRN